MQKGFNNNSGDIQKKKRVVSLAGKCWIGFGESRLVLQAAELCEDEPAQRQIQGLAAAFHDKSISSLPEEVSTPAFALACPYKPCFLINKHFH